MYLAVSLDGALSSFWPDGPRSRAIASLSEAIAPLRLVSTYHLFGHITRERIEPTFETLDASAWKSHDLRYKPGDPRRAPPFVAPHQPRVDFLLWFYGLSYEQTTPGYVRTLLDRLCYDPAAVQPLFVDPLPTAPSAVRVVLSRYHFTTPEERRRTSAWWKREAVGAERRLECQKPEP